MSDATLSVSKGVFVFKNGFKPIGKKSKIKRPNSISNSTSLFEDKLWFQSYAKLWAKIEKKIQALNEETFSSLLSNLVNFIKNSYESPVVEIPTATLLTGINMPDHSALFRSLTKEITKHVSPHCATLYAEECNNLKNMIESMIGQFVNPDENEISGLSDSEDTTTKRIKKNQCTFSLLQSWYELNYATRKIKEKNKKIKMKILVVIVPDFESFDEKILQDFVLIVSSYINVLPIAFIFGIATSTSALHKSLPYHVSSKLSIQVFQSQTSVAYLNKILENVFFTDDCPFHLGEKVFSLLIDQFLFYDLSVEGFVRNIKYMMLEHYSFGNAMALCTEQQNVKSILSQFNHDDLDNVRNLLSFQSFVEDYLLRDRIKLQTDDNFFRKVLLQQVELLYDHFKYFNLFLRCLHVLVQDLPNNPLGKQLRELYRIAVDQVITSTNEFKQSFRLLSFQSKDELEPKLKKVYELIESEKNTSSEIHNVIKSLRSFVSQLENLNSDEKMDECLKSEKSKDFQMTIAKSRKELREKLLKMTTESKQVNRYEKIRNEIIEFLTKMFGKFVQPPKKLPFHEILIFDNISVKNHIEGIHRASLHEALTNPQTFLQCDCCTLSNESSILKTMPDVCILYKLHLECGKLINLYDLLQSFLAIVEPDESDDRKLVKPEIQARFTQAIADLECLGFIKSSKRKTDHVSRLTWN